LSETLEIIILSALFILIYPFSALVGQQEGFPARVDSAPAVSKGSSVADLDDQE